MFRFLIRAAIFYTIWQVIYDLFLLPNGKLDEFLSLSVVYISKTILNIFGWDIHSLGRIITINGYRGVEVLNECNALTLMVLYSGFIICFQGSLQNKVKFVTVGILFIYFLNVIRIIAFSLATVYFQPHWELFHEFSPFIFFYPLILWLWYQWTLTGEKTPTPSSSEFSLA